MILVRPCHCRVEREWVVEPIFFFCFGYLSRRGILIRFGRRRPGNNLDLDRVYLIMLNYVVFHPSRTNRNSMRNLATQSINHLTPGDLRRFEKLREVQMLQIMGIVDGGQFAQNEPLMRKMHNIATETLDEPI